VSLLPVAIWLLRPDFRRFCADRDFASREFSMQIGFAPLAPPTRSAVGAFVLLASTLAVGAPAVAQGMGPSFQCARADGAVEKLVCQDKQLSEMDRETARLFKLALDSLSGNENRRNELVATERGWIKGRNDCSKDANVRPCVVASYAARIHELRQDYPSARTGGGISLGPFATRCTGISATISAVFINTVPSVVSLSWPNNALVLTQTLSGSGARYAAAGPNGETVFWNKGNEASFDLPGSPGHQCQLSPAG